MSLRFYTGASGAGKSTALYREIIDRSMAEPDRNFLVIVPDQFTMQTQMDLVRMHSRKGIMNIDVVSFSRLSHRVMEEVGQDGRTILDDTGKSLVLRRIAGKCKDQTTVIGGSLDKTGYIHEVKSAISEFMQYGIGPEELDALTEYARKRGGLYHKLKDLGVLYREFRAYTQEKFVTTEETLEMLARRLPQSELVRHCVAAVDGFTGFTPVQNRVLQTLMGLADEVIVSVTLGDGEDMRETGEEQGLFQLSKKTIGTLTRLAEEAGVSRGRDVRLPGSPVYRFRDNPSMAWLEQQLFRYPVKAWPGGADSGAGSFEADQNRAADQNPAAQRACAAKAQAEERGGLSVRIMEASTQREEVRQVFIAIREYLRRTGSCYRDVAIIAGDLASYASLLETEAAVYGIPLYLDRTRGIVLNPFIEYVKSALQIVVKNFSYEAVFHYLRSGLADFTPEEADELENYVLALGIRGKKKWSDRFTARPRGMEEGETELAALNASREKLLSQLSPLMESYADVKELVTGLYLFIEKNEVQRRLKEYEDRFTAAQDTVRAKEYAQIYRLVMELLDQIVELIGDEKVKREEFCRILEAGFSEIQVGTIPQNVDRVVAGDMERTRLNQVKALFFLGVNDGAIPKNASGGGIISDMDREFLAESGMELAPTPRQQMYIQRLYLYLNMTKPSDRLILSYARMSGEGRSLRPAYLIDMVRRLFPGIPIERPEEADEISKVQSFADGRDLLVQGLRRFADGRMEPDSRQERDFFRLFRVYADEPEKSGTETAGCAESGAAAENRAGDGLETEDCAESGKKEAGPAESRPERPLPWIEKMVQAAFRRYQDRPLGRAAALALFGSTLLGSVSRLEQYASCAYAHFLQYGLYLKEREDFSFEAVDMGNIFHGVLEVFGEKLQERGLTWFDFPEEAGEELIEEAVETYAASYGETILYDTARNQYMITRLKRILKRTVKTLQYQLRKGVFAPEQFEVSFSVLEELDAVNIALTEKEKLRLRGRIDRVDTWREETKDGEQIYVKVIDYKSGSRDFSLAALYYGLQLQLVVYMNAAMEMERRNHPGSRVIPAAMLYYRVHDPLVEAEGEEDAEAVQLRVQEELLAALRPTGVVNGEEKVIRSLDAGFAAKSDVIPVERKKDGSLSARSSVLPEEDFQVISQYVNLKIKELGTRILEGRIPLDPYIQPGGGAVRGACTYCPYGKVCGFDRRIPGFDRRELEKLTEEEALERMRRAVEEGQTVEESRAGETGRSTEGQ